MNFDASLFGGQSELCMRFDLCLSDFVAFRGTVAFFPRDPQMFDLCLGDYVCFRDSGVRKTIQFNLTPFALHIKTFS